MLLQVMETIGKLLPASLNSSAVYSGGGGMYMYVHNVCTYQHA